MANLYNRHLLEFQKEEITTAFLYRKLSDVTNNENNKKILYELSEKEYSHYLNIKNETHKDIKPNKLKIILYFLFSRIFGLTFGIKIIEYRQHKISKLQNYLSENPVFMSKLEQGEEDEAKMFPLIDDKRLDYITAIVLGLNDAIIEFTGALAGFSFAFSTTKVVAMAGAITGIAGAMSMGASEYMAQRTTKKFREALKPAVYCFFTYFFTVVLLISPFIIFDKNILALAATIMILIAIVSTFNFYYAIVKGTGFKHKFLEMPILSLSIAFISFIFGYALQFLCGRRRHEYHAGLWCL